MSFPRVDPDSLSSCARRTSASRSTSAISTLTWPAATSSGDPSQLLRGRARHEQLRAHAALSRRLLGRSAGDRGEDAALARGGQQRLRRLAARRVERDIDAAHRRGDVLLRAVDAFLRAKPSTTCVERSAEGLAALRTYDDVERPAAGGPVRTVALDVIRFRLAGGIRAPSGGSARASSLEHLRARRGLTSRETAR